MKAVFKPNADSKPVDLRRGFAPLTWTIAAEVRKPTGRRPLPLRFDRSTLTPDEVRIFDGMIQRGATCPEYVDPE
jgi:hypothetical protein